ncbi:MAG: DMT family transporter [Hyphomicrobiales bacterium]|nr:DMT family transporter [Hyphomicrobiales bacterium]
MPPLTSSVEVTQSHRPAIAVMCLGVLCLVTNDAIAKWLTHDYPTLQIVFLRYFLALPVLTAALLWFGGRTALFSRHLGVHILRGLFLAGSAYAFFLSLSYLPLAEATSIIFIAPILITALSVPLLGEHVGWRRWSAVIVGFIGVLIIVRPGGETFQPASLLVICTATLYALIMISARFIKNSESVWTFMFYMTLFPALFSGLSMPFVWQTPDWQHIPLFIGITITGVAGMILLSQAFRMAPAAVIAPFDYTALLWASLLGWLFWEEIPTIWTYAGAAVIIASGIYIVIRETRIKTPASERIA